MSEPSRRWISRDDLGREALRRAVVDRAERDAVVVDREQIVSRSEKTWKPPESVRIGPSQPDEACSPPSSAISSSPGRKCRW